MLVFNLLWGEDLLLMVGNYTFFFSPTKFRNLTSFSLGRQQVPLCVVKWLVCFRKSLQKHCLEPERSERWQPNYWAEVPLETSKGATQLSEGIRKLHSVPGTLGNIQQKQRYSESEQSEEENQYCVSGTLSSLAMNRCQILLCSVPTSAWLRLRCQKCPHRGFHSQISL